MLHCSQLFFAKNRSGKIMEKSVQDLQTTGRYRFQKIRGRIFIFRNLICSKNSWNHLVRQNLDLKQSSTSKLIGSEKISSTTRSTGIIFSWQNTQLLVEGQAEEKVEFRIVIDLKDADIRRRWALNLQSRRKSYLCSINNVIIAIHWLAQKYSDVSC